MPYKFVLTHQRPAKTEEQGNTLEAATAACKEEIRLKRSSSLLAILSNLRRDQDDDYIACMRMRGYEIADD